MQLREYQQKIVNEGCDILKEFNILYLAMQTRTGKTLTALSIIDKANFNNVLFVTKKKAIQSIESDYKKGGFAFSLTVINYESLHTINGNFDIIVCDEAHSLGAYPKKAKRVKDILTFTKGKPIIYLSATPAPESWSQLYHQFFISSFSPFAAQINFYKWASKYVNIQKKYLYNRELNDYSNANKQLIWNDIKHLLITITQEEAGFCQKVQEQVLTVPMPNDIFNAIQGIFKNNMYQGEDLLIIADTAAKVMNKVHQLCSGTVIDETGYKILNTFKADFLKKWVGNKKVVIFYKFKSEFEMLKNAFDNWTDNAFEFQECTDKVFLGQFQSAREGIRLDSADAIIFFSIDFSYLSYEQAHNRIASFERMKPAKLYWLFADKGIEKRIYKAVKAKTDYTLKFFKHYGIEDTNENQKKA